MTYLLQKGADSAKVDQDGFTALMQAAMCGHSATLEILLQHGNPVESKDEEGMTALMHAAQGD